MFYQHFWECAVIVTFTTATVQLTHSGGRLFLFLFLFIWNETLTLIMKAAWPRSCLSVRSFKSTQPYLSKSLFHFCDYLKHVGLSDACVLLSGLDLSGICITKEGDYVEKCRNFLNVLYIYPVFQYIHPSRIILFVQISQSTSSFPQLPSDCLSTAAIC